ncbi:MAG TPA: hypothetical protein VKB34_21365 [Povalibacter sp.]|nr:hypothetical protein [Povalibacter sp.]
MRRQRPSLLAILLSRLTRRRAPANPPAPVSRFQAVALYRGVQACARAMELCDQRFLLRDARPLPLPECTMPHRCECRYLRFKDRRAGARRLTGFGASRVRVEPERRKLKGRRGSD